MTDFEQLVNTFDKLKIPVHCEILDAFEECIIKNEFGTEPENVLVLPWSRRFYFDNCGKYIGSTALRTHEEKLYISREKNDNA